MKINLPCEIVMDLLPSYVDKLTSEMSTESVEEHLKECEKCQTVLEEMKESLREDNMILCLFFFFFKLESLGRG